MIKIEISVYFIRVVLMMIPGAISYKLFSIWVGNHSEYSYRSFIDIFIFSVVDYLTFDFLRLLRSKIFSFPLSEQIFLLSLLSENSDISLFCVIGSSCSGILIAAVASCVKEYDLISCIGQKIGFSKTSGRPTVWEDFLNSNDKWVYVRDHKVNLTYFGYIEYFSDANSELRELHIKDVSVFDENSELLYEVSSLLLSRNATDISIEVSIADPIDAQNNS